MTTEAIAPERALTVPQRAAAALNSAQHRIQLAELIQQSKTIVAVTNDDGREQAHAAAMKLRSTRTAIEKVGKTAREDATAFSKAVIAEENALIALIKPEETRVLTLRDEWDAKIEAEKQAKVVAERARVAAIQARIEEFRKVPVLMAGQSSATILQAIEGVQMPIENDLFGEFLEHASSVRAEVLQQLTAMAERQDQLEAEQKAARKEAELQRVAQATEVARIQAERAELEKLRAEQAARDLAARQEIQRQQAELAEKAAEIERKAKAEQDERDQIAMAEAKKLSDAQAALNAQMEEMQRISKSILEEKAALEQAQVQQEADVVAGVLSFEQPVSPVGPGSTTESPALRMGQITERLGFAITADFLRKLGFEPAGKDRSAILYNERDWQSICAALIRHISNVRNLHEQAA